MINLFKKRNTEWHLYVRLVYYTPFRVDQFCIRGKTKRKVFRLFKYLKRKAKPDLSEILNCEKVKNS